MYDINILLTHKISTECLYSSAIVGKLYNEVVPLLRSILWIFTLHYEHAEIYIDADWLWYVSYQPCFVQLLPHYYTSYIKQIPSIARISKTLYLVSRKMRLSTIYFWVLTALSEPLSDSHLQLKGLQMDNRFIFWLLTLNFQNWYPPDRVSIFWYTLFL